MKTQINLMGTLISLQLEGENAQQILEKTIAKLRDFERRFSANSSISQLAKVGENAQKIPTSVDSDVFELIKLGKENSLEAGFLNIAVGPLIKLWQIGFSGAQVPAAEEIQAKLALINPENIRLDEKNRTVFLEREGMALDLGAIAKGFFADKIIEFWQAEKATAGLIDLGGNVLAFGEKTFNVGIQNPFLPRGQYVAVLELENESCVTSGIYERKLTIGSKEFHHIFNPETGFPIESDVASLTIIAKKSVTCEILTTQLFGYSAVEIIGKVRKMPGVEAIVITKDGRMAQSNK